MTRAQLLTELARRLNKHTTLDTATQDRLLGFLNETHRELLSLPGLQRLRDDTITFASVASQARYALPWVPKVNRLFETTNDRVLEPMSLATYRDLDPDASSTTGTPSHWVWIGQSPVAKQPANASSLFVKSTSAGDTTQTLYVEGEIDGGYPRSASVTLTGTTAVNVSSSISTWVRVTKCYLSAAGAGVITLHEDSGVGTELAQIAIGQTSQRYLLLNLYPTPSAVVTYSADVVLGVTDLAQNTDEPRLPLDFHDLLVAGAMVREYEKTEDGRLSVSMARYQDRKRDLLYWLHTTGLNDARSNAMVRTSRLGPWYPAGS
jgi:hypothetical protein